MLSKLKDTKYQLALIAFATTLAYLNTLGNQFVWDDKTFAAWPLSKELQYLPDLLKGALPHPHEGDFRPFKGLILLLDYQLFKLTPFWYHLQAIIIHLATTILVYLVTRELLDQIPNFKMRLANQDFIPPLAALLFGIHPIHTEAITFVTSSTDMIGVIFFFLAFYFYLKHLKNYKNRKIYIALSLLWSAIAFIFYEITLVLPLVIVLFDVVVQKIKKEELSKRLKTYLLYIAIILLYLAIRFLILDVAEKNSLPEDNLLLGILTMVKVFARYLQITILPINLTVNHIIPQNIPSLFYIDYVKEAYITQKVADPQTLFSGAILLFAFSIALFFYKRFSLVTFCILWFFVSISPVSNIIPLNNFMSERYLYLASYGYCLLLSLAFVFAFDHFKKSGLAQTVIVLLFLTTALFFTIQTFLRNQDWKDSRTLWSKEQQAYPNSVLANHNLGGAYLDQGDIKQGIKHLEIASANDQTNNQQIILNLAQAYRQANMYPEAIEKYKLVSEKYPKDFISKTKLADLYREAKAYDIALQLYQESLSIEPSFYDAHIGLGLLYVAQNQFEGAENEFKTATKIRPELIVAWQNLGALYLKFEKYDPAQSALEKALKINPDNQQIKKMLILSQEGRNSSNTQN